MKKTYGFILILVALVLFFSTLYRNSVYSQKVHTFSNYTFLKSSWEKYKTAYINKDGRVLDHSQGDITTSEGQSYAMLRAVWIDDHDGFDLAWKWTKETLKRKQDNLFGWRWGMRADKKFGFIEKGGDNTASDADSDIALALLLASSRWSNPDYKNSALNIIKDIWDKETSTAKNKRYLTAGNWATNEKGIIINPSYFSPYAWRIFADVDQKHDWKSLITPAYDLLSNVNTQKLDKGSATGLPPDWVALDRKTGELLPTNLPTLTTNYSFDAMRIPFRIALDYQWNLNSQAQDYLNKTCKVLSDIYNRDKKLGYAYSHSGDIINAEESPAIYGASIGCVGFGDKAVFKNIYEDKIVKLYSNTDNEFNPKLSYYDQNWLWFGAAMYNKQIVNFIK